jgi:chaperonin cofactor prefoldin
MQQASQQTTAKPSLEKSVQDWVSLDNQIKTLTEKIKQLRERKEELSGHIESALEERNMAHMPIQISDGRLKLTRTHVAQPLTFAYLQQSLQSMLQNETKVAQMIAHIKKNRAVKEGVELRRYTQNLSKPSNT